MKTNTQRRLGLAGLLNSLFQACVLLYVGFSVSAATFTINTLINASDSAYDGQDILIQGCTVTINGAHAFNSLQVLSGGVLTHSVTTPAQENRLDLTLANGLVVDSTSRIDVSGCGYGNGYTLNNTTVGGATRRSGGSYGGLGINSEGTANAVYGDYRNPNELGSGGAGWDTNAGNGGGLVRITARSLQIDGQILANGGNGSDRGDYGGGGGSGGAIWLSIGTLTGSGQISANGGAGANWGGAGGGGRVAIHYTTVSAFDLANQVSAHGAQNGSAVGTVYFKPDGGLGQLLVSSHGGTAGLWTPLGTTSDTALRVDHLIIAGTGVVTAPIREMPIQAHSIIITNSAVLTHQPTTSAQEYSLRLAITNNLYIDPSAQINVSSRGYLNGSTLGNTNFGGATIRSGGSYGGLGAASGGTANWVYGDYRNPAELGSGGAGWDGNAGPGGGLVRITAANAQVEGQILANGSNGSDRGDYGGGGGSGGAIWMTVNNLSGSGSISANGGVGANWGGGGGGGRVAIYYGAANGFDLQRNVTAHGSSQGGASVGTIYLRLNGTLGQLLVTSHGAAAGNWTPLGMAEETVFQADNLVIAGTNVVAAPAHEMPIHAHSITLSNAAVLWHQPTTAAQEYSLHLNITNTLIIDAPSLIEASGCGYLNGYTLGNTNAGAAARRSGGSYGGLGTSSGDNASQVANAVYGDYRNPNELGSGGAGWGSNGGPGGGLIHITVNSAKVDGGIRANGASGSDRGDYGGGGGSGGAVWLSVSNLSGSGVIAANGGAGSNWGGGGGGGRIAIFFEKLTGFDVQNQVVAHGGIQAPGAVGTVYLKAKNSLGELLLSSHGTATGTWTPLGMTSETIFEVENLVIAGTNVVAAPAHEMPIQANGIWVTNGALLTHQPTTPAQEHSLRMTIANGLVVDANSRIDVSARGYTHGYSLGNSTNSAANGRCGASYGGLGAASSGTPNPIYGDYHNPTELGSGGAGWNNNGGPGGGMIRITAATIQVEGALLANGGNAIDEGDYGGGGGSGGAIWLNVGNLGGAGIIAANGGAGRNWGGGGSGGRIAIFYNTATSFDLPNNVTTHGGAQGGAVGTVYLKPNAALGQLLLVSHGSPAGTWTPLGMTNDTEFQAENLVISGAGMVVAPAHEMPILANNLTLLNGAVLTHQPTDPKHEFSLRVTVTNNLLVDASSRIDVSGRGYVNDPAYGGSLTLGNTHSGAATVRSGASYGGLGFAASGGDPNVVYGDYTNPNELGSSGASTYGNGGAGGGLIRITAGNAQVDGQVLANGANAIDHGDYGGGGGSGGGIWFRVNSLSGTGLISANGGAGSNWGGGGGGGRVAIHYGTVNGFGLYTNVTAHGGSHNAGAVGTVFLKADGALAELLLTSHDTEAGMWTPLGIGADSAFTVDNLVVSGTNVVAIPEHELPVQANAVWVTNGAALNHLVSTAARAYSLRLNVISNLVVDASSRIDVSSRGYPHGVTFEGSASGPASGRSGASYGGLGANSSGQANELYGDYHNPNEVGSGGAGWNDNGGAGGGLVRIIAQGLQLDGALLANGSFAQDHGDYGGGGGSGGAILVNAGNIYGSGVIAANGGGGANWGGPGGGGRVAVYTWKNFSLSATNVTANAGPGSGAQNGSVFFATSPLFSFGSMNPLLHGIVNVSWFGMGVDPSAVNIQVQVSRAGVSYPVGTSSNLLTTLPWDTRGTPDGIYAMRGWLLSKSGQLLSEDARTILINNSVLWHGGILAGNETWAAGTVHVVDKNLIIPNGVTVTIAPGAIIKIARNVSILIQGGGMLNALGTANLPIIITSLADDTAAGDTNMDGSQSLPRPGDWQIAAAGGQFNQNDYADIRYSIMTLGGTLASSRSLLGNQVYLVTNNVVVPGGIQLTINPGAVVKFATGVGITVNSGGVLNANGTLAKPITFTSLLDDTIGGDTNGDGDATQPAPGDWVGINFTGGQGFFNHSTIRYGGNTGSGAFASGVLIVNGGSLSVSNSAVESTLYDGISVYGSGGTAILANSFLRDLDRAIWAWGGGNVHLLNCTFDENRAGLVQHGDATITAENCIVANSIQGSVTEGACTLRYCNLWSRHAGASNPGVIGQNGNISQDPKFKDVAQEDYRLDYGSPCIDAADGSIAPATDLVGAPRYTDPRTQTKAGVSTGQGQYADMGALEFVETAVSALDLIGLEIDAPHQVVAGDTVLVSWTIANMGNGTVVGPWHDLISISNVAGGAVLPALETLVGQGVVLGPGESHFASALLVVPPGMDGQYLWQLQVNHRGEVFEGVNWTNNALWSAPPTLLTTPELPIGAGTITNRFSFEGQSLCFRLVPGSNADVIIRLKQWVATGAVELYAAEGYVPTPQHFDLQQLDWNTPSPELVLSALAGRTYYLVAYARALPAGSSTFTIDARIPGFEVTSVEPPEVGNGGSVTVRIYGSQFQPGDVAEAVNGGTVIPAQVLKWVNSALLEATFDFTAAQAGSWNVRVRHTGGLAATLTDALTIQAGGAPNVAVQIVGRQTIRAGRVNEYQLAYANSGNLDAYYVILVLTGVPNSATVTFGSGFESTAQPQGVTNWVPLALPTEQGLVFTPIALERLGPGEGGSATFTINVPPGTGPFNITPLILGAGRVPVAGSYYNTNSPRPLSFLPCSPADEDLAGANYLLKLAIDYYKYGRFANWFWNEACVGEAGFMMSIYEPETLPVNSPIKGWTFSIVSKNGLGIGHTTVLAASPSGHYYIIDNYVVPTIIPVWHSGPGQWRISTDCLLAPGNAFLALDKLITAAGGGFAWKGQEPTGNSNASACPMPVPGPSQPVKPSNSSDPNLKVGPAGANQFITGDEPMPYQIYFENKATATAPAQEVLVTDTLSANLDWSTFELSRIGFNGVIIDIPPGLQWFTTNVFVSTDPNPVKVIASLNPNTGVATWDILSIDPVTSLLVEDPLAGFLPPDNALAQGQGFVSYRIRAKGELATGTQILNQANIIFDVNAPIVTPIVTNIVDTTAPTSSVDALPASTAGTNVMVTWAGSDAHSGIAAYSIYVAEDSGPWLQWLWNIPTNSASFAGLPGHTYSFFSLATDAVGNQEFKAPVAEATTSIPGGAPRGPVLAGAILPGQQFQVSYTWNLGATNILESSTDLVNWSPVATFINTNGALLYREPGMSRDARRFYRVRIPNP